MNTVNDEQNAGAGADGPVVEGVDGPVVEGVDGPVVASVGRPVVVRYERPIPMNGSLKCVWSGYPGDESDGCYVRVPTVVAERAWRRELERGELVQGFFHFSWRKSVWLAYGASDGSVRGVYCPTHRSERAARRADMTGGRPARAVQSQPA